MKRKTIAVIGGDKRLYHMLRLLPQRSFCGASYGLYIENYTDTAGKNAADILPHCDIVIFGLPMLNPQGEISAPLGINVPGLKEVFEHITPDTILFGGSVQQSVLTLASRKKVEIFDYITREEFAVRNAIPTAEGAVQLALRGREATLYGANCLVLGYGRIGKALTRLLLAFGASVTVAARKPSDLEWIRLSGALPATMSSIDSILPGCDIIFNTVPALLLDEQRLCSLLPECMVIDLASLPGGVDVPAAKRLGILAEQALSLPGKLAPASAGKIILDTIENILTERGFIHE